MPSLTLAGINRRLVAERYIRSTMPIFWTDLSRHDGNQFISDDAFGHQMTVTGATWGIQGRTFDGIDDYIGIPDAANLYLANAFSIGFWFNKTNAAGEILLAKDIAPYGATDREWNIEHNAAGKLYWEVYGAAGAAQLATNTTPLNVWNHAFFTFDGTNLRIYSDAVLNSTPTAFTGPLTDTATEIRIGQRSSAQYLHGTIGEVLIYNRALSIQEIQHLFELTKWRYI